MLVRKALVATIFSVAASVAMAHGDVTPQVVDVSTLKPLGDDMLDTNPYVGDKEAIRVVVPPTTRIAHVAMVLK